MSGTFRTHYIPATSVPRHDAGRARYGIPPSRNASMAEFLVSPRLQHTVLQVAEDIADVARNLARTELQTAKEGASMYLKSIEARVIPPVVAGRSPRAAAAVTAHGGRASWGGFTDPESSHAAIVEFGNPAAPNSGRRILGRAGITFHTPKGLA